MATAIYIILFDLSLLCVILKLYIQQTSPMRIYSLKKNLTKTMVPTFRDYPVNFEIDLVEKHWNTFLIAQHNMCDCIILTIRLLLLT